MSSDPKRSRARELAATHLARGDALGWFEPLYAQAGGVTANVPWADLRPNPHLTEWFDAKTFAGDGRTALVVGCGLGDDAEFLADRGFRMTAFDLSPTAIAWCHSRFPTTAVHYEVADLLAPPESWRHAFDFVFEAYTLQVLPPTLREPGSASLATLVRQGGKLLVICRARQQQDPEGQMPWPLLREELSVLERVGLTLDEFEEFWDRHEDPPVRRFRAAYSCPGG
jgi:SAM-dependent methyltransferase